MKLNDRERILIHIIRELDHAMLKAQLRSGIAPGPNEARFDVSVNPKPGDIVLAQSAREPSEWVVAWYERALEDGAIVREIGTGKLCRYRNESFHPLVGFRADDFNGALLEGAQFEYFTKVKRAMGLGITFEEDRYRFNGCRFDGDHAIVSIREKFGRDTVPFDVRLKWHRRKSIKAIREELRAGGFGTRVFDKGVAS